MITRDIKDTDTYQKVNQALRVMAVISLQLQIMLVKMYKIDQEVINQFLAIFVSCSSCCALYCVFMYILWKPKMSNHKLASAKLGQLAGDEPQWGMGCSALKTLKFNHGSTSLRLYIQIGWSFVIMST